MRGGALNTTAKTLVGGINELNSKFANYLAINNGAINKSQITTGTLKEYYFQKSLTVTSSWQDTGISSTNLETGLYAIRVNNIYVTSKT